MKHIYFSKKAWPKININYLYKWIKKNLIKKRIHYHVGSSRVNMEIGVKGKKYYLK